MYVDYALRPATLGKLLVAELKINIEGGTLESRNRHKEVLAWGTIQFSIPLGNINCCGERNILF